MTSTPNPSKIAGSEVASKAVEHFEWSHTSDSNVIAEFSGWGCARQTLTNMLSPQSGAKGLKPPEVETSLRERVSRGGGLAMWISAIPWELRLFVDEPAVVQPDQVHQVLASIRPLERLEEPVPSDESARARAWRVGRQPLGI